MIVFANTLKRIFKAPTTYLFLLLFPAVFALLISFSTANSGEEDVVNMVDTYMTFGVVDLDESRLSERLIASLEKTFVIEYVSESDITAVLTDQAVSWILRIPDGYGEAILAGTKPELEGYSIRISDVSQLGAAAAESITRSLMLLGTDDQAVLEQWAERSEVAIHRIDTTDNWENVTFWLGFFGFTLMLSVFFVARALIADKRQGMPDRLGIIPISQRRFLIQSALAVFAATEITVALMLGTTLAILGTVPHALLLFVILSLYNLFAVCAIMAVISLARDMGVISIIVSISITILAMLGGAFWPLEIVPPFMQKLAWFSPNYWLTRGIGGLQELDFGDYGLSVLFLLVFTVVAILLGGWNTIQKLNEDG